MVVVKSRLGALRVSIKGREIHLQSFGLCFSFCLSYFYSIPGQEFIYSVNRERLGNCLKYTMSSYSIHPSKVWERMSWTEVKYCGKAWLAIHWTHFLLGRQLFHFPGSFVVRQGHVAELWPIECGQKWNVPFQLRPMKTLHTPSPLLPIPSVASLEAICWSWRSYKMERGWSPGKELPVQQEHPFWTLYDQKNKFFIVLSH